MKTKVLTALLVLLIASTYLPLQINATLAQTSTQRNVISLQYGKVGIIIGNGTTYQEPLIQTIRTLENEGLVYQVITDTNIQAIINQTFNLIIVLGSTDPQLENSANILRQKIQNGTAMIWVSSNLPTSLYDLAGLSQNQSQPFSSNITGIKYGQLTTQTFNETFDIIQPEKAIVQGYFIGNNSQQIAPAELSYKQNQNGLVYYFAYDVCSWWVSDLTAPWLRAYRLEMAINNALSDKLTVLLAPYPQNYKSVFITRIEDVDPLHTSTEWLTRANKFLNYYTSKDATLTVGVIPRYIDPQQNIDISLQESSASSLRNWLSTVILRGGTIIQHGYTHQFGNTTTGLTPEFFNTQTGQWLSLNEQKQRIQTGEGILKQSLGFTPEGFEAPHYVANNDTYQALNSLGFKYTTHNTNSPYAEQYGYSGLINIPETLGYLPLNNETQTQPTIEANMDMLYNMSGVMLYFNHLFTDASFQVGENLLNYAKDKQNVWITNTDNLATFSIQRLNAYQNMSITTENNRVTVTLGSANIAGLTLTLNNTSQIKSVTINGQQWPTFTKNFIVLPTLPNPSNTITIDLNNTQTNANMTTGYIVLSITSITSVFLVAQTIVSKKQHANKNFWRKQK